MSSFFNGKFPVKLSNIEHRFEMLNTHFLLEIARATASKRIHFIKLMLLVEMQRKISKETFCEPFNCIK